MKVCRHCGIEKQYSDYHKHKKRKDGVGSWCKVCANAAKASRVDEINKIIRNAKDVPCQKCGIKYPFYVMDLHHRDPNEKEYRISRMRGMRPEKVIAELAKCDVLCANCHREVEYG